MAAFALLAALTGCAGGAGVATGAVGAAHEESPTASKPPGATPTPTPTPSEPQPSALPVGAADAGTLPQTSALPKTTGTDFGNTVHDIWLAVTTGDPDYARPAFFPEKAYERVKAIANPESDWDGRLWYDFTLDIAAAHKLADENATLTKVVTPTQYAQWIPAGACFNTCSRNSAGNPSVISLSMKLGQRAATTMPRLPYSRARARAKPTSACLLAV